MQKMSKGEERIANLLTKAKIYYKTEVSFEGLKGARGLLRFDFVIYSNNKIICCEYDGKQHFMYTPHFHRSQLDFRRQKEYDIRKNKYCLNHNVPLIRIPYWALDGLTLEKLFSTPEFIVRTPYHNINLINKGVRK